MPTEPTLSFPGFDAVWRVAKVQDAERAKVAYGPVPSARPLCFVKVDDFWVRRESGPWVVAYRLVLQGGRLVIGELRVYPRVQLDPDDDKSGVLPPWDATRDLQGVHGSAPPGGLTATVVHRITPAHDVNVGRLIMNGLRGRESSIWKHLLTLGVHTEEAPPPATTHRKGGPPGKGLAFYRTVARVCNSGQRPVWRAVAQALGITESQARDAIHRARHRYGLVEHTTRGVRSTVTLQRIATEGKTRGQKAPQVRVASTKNARQSQRREKRA